MNQLWQFAGNVTYRLAWPALFFYLRGSKRTRILIVHDKKLLVVKRWLDNGKWCLPGGGRHENEEAVVGALRELHEETGLVLGPNDLKAHGAFAHHGDGFNFTYELFSVQLATRPEVHLQRYEIVDYAWLTPVELEMVATYDEIDNSLHLWSA